MKIVKKCEWEKNPSRLKHMKIVKKLYEIISFIQDRKSFSPKTHENRKKLRVGKKTWSPKTHENREKMTKFHDITVFF